MVTPKKNGARTLHTKDQSVHVCLGAGPLSRDEFITFVPFESLIKNNVITGAGSGLLLSR